MADGKKISELTKLSNLADADEFVVVNKDVTSGDESGIGGQTSRITFSDLKSEIGTQGPQGPAGGDGASGKSAYDLWIEAGNTGSIAQFLESLKGSDGSDGAVGPSGPTGPKGETGDSAFTVTSSGQLSLGDNKVGIGIDDAQATLHIKDSRPTLRLTDGASPGVADYEIANDDDILFIRSIPGENILVIDNKNVGIGTTPSAGRLHVIGGNSPTEGFTLGGRKDDGEELTTMRFFHDDTDHAHISRGLKKTLSLSKDGKVGIGEDEPSSLLHVKSDTGGAHVTIETTQNTGSTEAILHLKTPTSHYGLFANDGTDQFGIGNYRSGAESKYPMKINGNGNVTFDGIVSADGFSVNGKDLTGADLRGPEGPAGPAGKDGTNGTDGAVGSSNAHLGLIHDSTITLNDSENQVFKKTGSNGWNASVRSSIGYNSGCSLSFTANINNRAGMIGINTDPTTNNNYNTIDFAWYMTGSGAAYIYENGASKGSFGAFSVGAIFVITYDNNTVRYYLNGTLKRSVTIGAGKTYYLDSSFHTVDSRPYTRTLSFHPMGAVGTKGDKGDKGSTGARGAQGVAGPSGPVGIQGPAGPSGQPVSVTSPEVRWDASSWSTGGTLNPIIGDKPIYLGGEEGNFGESSTIRLDGSRGKVFNLPPRGKRKSGGNYIQAGDVYDNIFMSGSFTISFWVRVRKYETTTGSSSAGRYGAIMSKWYTAHRNGTNNSFIIYSNGTFYSSYSATTSVTSSTNYPKLNEWCHLSYVCNNGTMTVYRNGKEVPTKFTKWSGAANQSNKHLFLNSNQRLEVGSIRNNGSYSLDGMVDDIRIFDKPLSSGEVWFTYNGVGGGGLVGPQGPQGAKGSTGSAGQRGPAGPTGPRGLQGVRGANGNVGAPGPRGPKGDTGAKGADGVSATENYASNKRWEVAKNKSSFLDEGTGGSFNVNGTSAENYVDWEIGPFGRRTKVWKARNNDTASNADGGWNKTITNLKKNAAYMSVVYVRRTSSNTSGYFYHGCAQGTHTLNLSGSTNRNPYFKHFVISNLPLNVWCLSVGYIHANNDPDKSSYGGGLYRIDNGKKIMSYTDYKMGTSGTQTHRTYLYYSTSPAAALDWTLPGFYEVCSDSPTLGQLLGGGGVLGGGEKGPQGPAGSRGPAGPAGPMPNISEIQNQQFGVLKTNRLDMNGDIEMDRNGSYSRSIKFNSTCNINSSPQNNMHYRSTGGKHHFTNGSNGAGTIVVDKLEANKLDLSAISFSGSTTTFKGTSNWSNVTIDGMGGKAWRGNGFYVHRADNKMYAAWNMDVNGATRFGIHAHSGAGVYKDWRKYIFDNYLMIDTNRSSVTGRHSTIRTHQENTNSNPNSLHILANHGDLLLEANNIRKGTNQNATVGGHGSVIFRAHGVPVISHVVDTTNSNHANYKKQRGDYVYGGTSGANAYNRYRQKHFQGNSRSGVTMKLIGGALIPGTGVVDLGAPVHAHRFDTLWCRNAPDVYSDKRAKTKIESSDLGLDFINKLKPVSYKYKDVKILTEKLKSLDGNEENEDRDKDELEITKETHGRTHYGMIAQDVEKVLEGKDFGGFVDPNHALDDDDEGKGELHMSLRYEEFISPMIKAIQEVDDKIEDLEKYKKFSAGRVSKLESKHETRNKNSNKEIKEIKDSQKKILDAISEITKRLDKIEKSK